MPSLLTRLHAATGTLALVIVAMFWSSTVVSELFAGPAAVAAVKQAILWSMLLLIPALAATGLSGARLARNTPALRIAAKRRRMQIAAGNGLLVLLPCAVVLAGRAADGRFDDWFYAIQGLELLAGALNIALLGRNLRDGLALARARRTAMARAGADHALAG